MVSSAGTSKISVSLRFLDTAVGEVLGLDGTADPSALVGLSGPGGFGGSAVPPNPSSGTANTVGLEGGLEDGLDEELGNAGGALGATIGVGATGAR